MIVADRIETRFGWQIEVESIYDCYAFNFDQISLLSLYPFLKRWAIYICCLFNWQISKVQAHKAWPGREIFPSPCNLFLLLSNPPLHNMHVLCRKKFTIILPKYQKYVDLAQKMSIQWWSGSCSNFLWITMLSKKAKRLSKRLCCVG